MRLFKGLLRFKDLDSVTYCLLKMLKQKPDTVTKMKTLITKDWNKTTKVHSLNNQISIHVSPHIKKQTTEVLLKNVQAIGSEHIQKNGNEMFENFREFLENHTYLKAVTNSTSEMLMHRIVQSVDLNAMNSFQMKADQVLCHFTTL